MCHRFPLPLCNSCLLVAPRQDKTTCPIWCELALLYPFPYFRFYLSNKIFVHLSSVFFKLNMSLKGKTKSALLKSWLTMFNNEKEIFTTDGHVLFCQPCGKEISCDRKSQLEQHILTSKNPFFYCTEKIQMAD